jgi:hypothetical protein
MNAQDLGDLQEQACWVMLYVAATSLGTSESMVQRGTVDSIIASMRACDRHEGVQAQGCWALANLATNSDINSRVIYENRGVDAIIAAMRLHPANLSVQAKACRALGRISRHCEASCGHIREYGGVEQVMQCMNTHKTSSTVQTEGTEFLRVMAGEFLKGMGVDNAETVIPEVCDCALVCVWVRVFACVFVIFFFCPGARMQKKMLHAV